MPVKCGACGEEDARSLDQRETTDQTEMGKNKVALLRLLACGKSSYSPLPKGLCFLLPCCLGLNSFIIPTSKNLRK